MDKSFGSMPSMGGWRDKTDCGNIAKSGDAPATGIFGRIDQ